MPDLGSFDHAINLPLTEGKVLKFKPFSEVF